jgi:Uma2 family endonuclease
MSLVDHSEPKLLPPLIEGQKLDQPTFHERYEAMLPRTRAELIGGVVFMSSPVSYEHGRKNDDTNYVFKHYERFTEGVEVLCNVTTFLDIRNEVQPDAMLRIHPEYGGQTRPEGKYIGGAPELIVEIAISTRSKDLGRKLREYEKTGVLEYVVATSRPDAIIWHVRRNDQLVPIPPGPDGLFRSEVFPGLWLDPAALLSRDLNQLIAVLDRGLATEEHAAFVRKLAEAKANSAKATPR